MRGNPLPFDVDPDLVDSAAGPLTDLSEEDRVRALFPPVALVPPPPFTAETRKTVEAWREIHAASRKSWMWSGSEEELAAYDAAHAKGKARSAADAFDSMDTYSKRKRAKLDAFVPPEKRVNPKDIWLPGIPKCLWDLCGVPVENDESKKKGAAKKSIGERLAKLDEGKDDEAGDADDESVEGAEKSEDDEDGASEPQDSEFEEDEADDADNDYNAEKHFDDGEDDNGSVAGEEADEGFDGASAGQQTRAYAKYRQNQDSFSDDDYLP